MSDTAMLARALESAIFTSLQNAQSDPAREDYWFHHADLMERRFTRDFGRHYSYFLGRDA